MLVPGAAKDWTVMVYAGVDNDLADTKKKLLARELQGIPDSVDIVTLLDDGSTDKNMADPSTLRAFVQEQMKEHPAENYALVLASHGGGFKGMMQDDGSKDWMSLPELTQALDGIKVDVLALDACMMGQVEVAYQLRDNAEVLIASENTIGAGSWPYRAFSHPGPDARSLGEAVLQDAKESGLTPVTVVDQNRIGAAAEAIAELRGAMRGHKEERIVLSGGDRIVDNIGAPYSEFKDALGFLTLAERRAKLPEAGVARQKLQEAIMGEHHQDYQLGHRGLTMYLPTGAPDPEYAKTEFAGLLS